MLNRYTMKSFNKIYYALKSSGKKASLAPYDSFFYPLDGIGQWNLVYGKQGFLQYQCVVPENSSGAIEELLRLIAESGMGSFLGVLKRFGAAPPAGMLSFPREGLTLALDFAMRGEPTLRLMEALDRVVLSCGGALYPAKDARDERRDVRRVFSILADVSKLYRSETVVFFLEARHGDARTVMKKAVILGATSGIAQELQRLLIKEGVELLLVARSAEHLTALAADLETRGAVKVAVFTADLANLSSHAEQYLPTRRNSCRISNRLLAYTERCLDQETANIRRNWRCANWIPILFPRLRC